MNDNHENYFKTTYPDIFPSYLVFEIGDGWFHPINEMSRAIMEHCHDTGTPAPVCVQIKEKFGSLRFYTAEVYDEVISSFIQQAEAMCYTTCDVCGASGMIYEDGWVRVRCDEHVNG